jgi:hypothetical protein
MKTPSLSRSVIACAMSWRERAMSFSSPSTTPQVPKALAAMMTRFTEWPTLGMIVS